MDKKEKIWSIIDGMRDIHLSLNDVLVKHDVSLSEAVELMDSKYISYIDGRYCVLKRRGRTWDCFGRYVDFIDAVLVRNELIESDWEGNVRLICKSFGISLGEAAGVV